MAVLNLEGPTIDHSFDCSTTTGSPNDLMWQRGGGLQRFPTEVRILTLDDATVMTYSMNLAPTTGRASNSDLDVYTCVNNITNERAFITITGGINT